MSAQRPSGPVQGAAVVQRVAQADLDGWVLLSSCYPVEFRGISWDFCVGFYWMLLCHDVKIHEKKPEIVR